MAEEILYTRKSASALVLEVKCAVREGERPSLHKLWAILNDPDLVVRPKFRLLDAAGHEVVFPLKLV